MAKQIDLPIQKVVSERENGSRRVIHICQGPSQARDSMKDQTDINNIVKRYQKTGTWSHVAQSLPWYGDATQITDYRDAIDAVKRAEESFMALPAQVRKEFANDPSQLISFLQNPANKAKAIELGLVLPESPKSDPASAPAPEEKPSS